MPKLFKKVKEYINTSIDKQSKKNYSMEEIKECCYADLEGNAYTILSLLLNNNKSEHINKFFDIFSENELKFRHFKNIDWESIARIANACVSRKETLTYLERIK